MSEIGKLKELVMVQFRPKLYFHDFYYVLPPLHILINYVVHFVLYVCANDGSINTYIYTFDISVIVAT